MSSSNQIPITDKILELTRSMSSVPGGTQRDRLIALINELINQDFQSLVQLLYRIDVDEKKLKALLSKAQGAASAPIIADLLIERQLQKARTRAQFSGGNPPTDEERW